MVAKIKLELDDATGPGFNSFKQGMDGASQAAQGLERNAQGAGSEVERLTNDLYDSESVVSELTNKVAQLHAELDELDGDGVEDLEAEIGELRAKLDAAGESAKKFANSQQTAGRGSMDFANNLAKLWALKETFKKIGEGIAWMAEKGNPAMEELVQSARNMQNAFLEAAEDPALQESIKSLAETINSTLVPAMKGLPGYWKATQDGIANAITATGEYFGVFAEGSSETLSQIQNEQKGFDRVAQQRSEQAKAEKAAQKQLADADKVIADAERARAAQAEQDRLNEINDKYQIDKLEIQEIQRIKDLAKEQKLTDQDKQDSARRLQQFEARRRSIDQEAENVAKQSAAEVARAKEDAAKQAAAEQQKQLDAEVAADKAAKQAKLDAEKSYREKLKAMLSGQDAGAKSVVDRVRGGVSDKEVAQKILKDRQTAAARQVEEKAKLEGKIDEGGRAIGGTEEDKKTIQRQLDAERKRAEADARKMFARDKKQGNISAQEIEGAKTELTDAVIGQAESTGKLNREQAQAAREALRATSTLAAEQAKLAADYQVIKSTLDAITGQSERRQSQRRGSGR